MSNKCGTKDKISFLAYFSVLSIFLINLCMILDFFLNVTSIEELKRITYFPSVFVSSVKAINLLGKPKRITDIIDDIDRLWKPNKFDKETEMKVERIFRQVAILNYSYSGSLIVCCMVMSSMPFLSFKEKSLIFSDFAFCCLQNYPCWIPMYIWQFYLLNILLVPTVLAFDCLFCTLISYVVTACELLRVALLKLNANNLLERKYILREIVKQHNIILNFLKSTNAIFTEVMLVQFMCSLLALILMLNMIVANRVPPRIDDLSYFGTLYLVILSQIFIYSTGGVIIEEKIMSIANDIFSVNWSEKDRTELRKDLSFMIFRAQKTRVLNAGKMSNLNYPLFLSTMRSSMSIGTLIYQLKYK